MAGEILVNGGTVIFKLRGMDKLLALKSEIKIPIYHIVSVSTEKVPWNALRQVRIGGTGLIGVIKDGSFLSGAGLLFYQMRDPNRCVSVELREERYTKIIFEVQDKEIAARSIETALASSGSFARQ